MITERRFAVGHPDTAATVQVISIKDGVYEVQVGDKKRRVDVHQIQGSRWSLLIDHKSYDLDLQCTPTQDRAALIKVWLEGHRWDLLIQEERLARLAAARGPSTQSDGAQVDAPMPGRVTSILVAPGDQVAAHQPLLVIEAMKMENELRAPQAGVVASIEVKEGQAVDGGDRLMVLRAVTITEAK